MTRALLRIIEKGDIRPDGLSCRITHGFAALIRPTKASPRTREADILLSHLNHGAKFPMENHLNALPLGRMLIRVNPGIAFLLVMSLPVLATPLHDAADSNSHEVAALLIDKSADINAKDNGGYTPLDIAKSYKAHDVIRLLER